MKRFCARVPELEGFDAALELFGLLFELLAHLPPLFRVPMSGQEAV